MSTAEHHLCDAAGSAGRLADQRAVITGAGRGIGAEIARTFAAHGATVAILDVRADSAAIIAKEIDGLAVGVDLRDPDATKSAMAEAIAELGGVDILVNNAGVLKFAPLLEIDVADWDLTFDVNVRAMLITTQVAARAMIQSKAGGTIINMASMGGKLGAPNQAHYAASKAAVISLTQVAAMELGSYGIRVNAICPGYVLTEMGAATRTQAMIDAWSAKSPLGRLGQPADVARMALFLASTDAGYCTGQAMNVTGGMMMQ
jgi:NAD(P)-dependent dehydrogenase (short-subunit alcohol dehydrogenase family)